MKLKINGEVKVLSSKPKPKSLSELVEQLGHQPCLIVIEFNGQILPRENWDKQQVKDGDTLEIVTIVGGGS